MEKKKEIIPSKRVHAWIYPKLTQPGMTTSPCYAAIFSIFFFFLKKELIYFDIGSISQPLETYISAMKNYIRILCSFIFFV